MTPLKDPANPREMIFEMLGLMKNDDFHKRDLIRLIESSLKSKLTILALEALGLKYL